VDKLLGVKGSSCHRPEVKSKTSKKFIERIVPPDGWDLEEELSQTMAEV
jgi:hypothetical protein